MVRIVFFGTPAFAVPSLEALIASAHEVVAVVSQPDRPRGRGQQLQPTPTRQVAATHAIPVLQPSKIRDEAFLQQVRDLHADLGVVVAFGRILPDSLLAIPRLGMINVHASILPFYRGAAPIQRAVLAGDRETGVTIMRVASELDAGPTFSMARVPVPPDATSGDMEGVLASLGAELLVPVVDDLEAGRAVEVPQDHSRATFAPKITKDEGIIDWNAPAETIHNRIRGLQPWPLASTSLNGTRIVLRRSRVRSADRSSPGVRSPDLTSGARPPDAGLTPLAQSGDLTPGSGPVVRSGDLTPGSVRATHGAMTVVCGDGAELEILELQPEGKRTMTAREFLAGRGLPHDARFGS